MLMSLYGATDIPDPLFQSTGRSFEPEGPAPFRCQLVFTVPAYRDFFKRLFWLVIDSFLKIIHIKLQKRTHSDLLFQSG